MDKQLKVTSLEELALYQEGTLVELPPFGPDQPFVARLKRPSIMALAKAGKIPNSLLNAANELFYGRQKTAKMSNDAMKETFEVIDILCEASFVEPKYEDLKRIGLELSDDQYMFVFNFTQMGVKALDSFRSEQGHIQDTTTV